MSLKKKLKKIFRCEKKMLANNIKQTMTHCKNNKCESKGKKCFRQYFPSYFPKQKCHCDYDYGCDSKCGNGNKCFQQYYPSYHPSARCHSHKKEKHGCKYC